MSSGRAFANGAISVVNAIITGHAGASLGIRLRTEAKVTLLEDVPEVEVVIDGKEAGPEGQLARLVLKGVVSRLGEPEWGGRVETVTDIPSSRGLKSSSAAANAVALATNQAMQRFDGRALSRGDLLACAIDAALDAGVTITGAYDDATASLHGGLQVTDNKSRTILHREEVPEDLVIVLLVPESRTPTASVRDLPYAPFAPFALEAHKLARTGRWREALTLNGLVAGALYGVPPTWTRDALAAGAMAAGVSGTGPAFATVCTADASKMVEAALVQMAPTGARILRTRPTNKRAEVLP